jgi:hypothetical protein
MDYDLPNIWRGLKTFYENNTVFTVQADMLDWNEWFAEDWTAAENSAVSEK